MLLQARLGSQVDEQFERLVGDAVFAVVDVEGADGDGEPRPRPGSSAKNSRRWVSPM
jgi:hypothetical protein